MGSVRVTTSNINEICAKLKNISKNINNVSKEIAKDIANDGKAYLENLYEGTVPENMEKPDINVEPTDKGANLVVSGDDVLYIEFGTGDRGESNSHPEKGEYDLNAYNSGKTIRDVSTLMDSIERNIMSNDIKTQQKAKEKLQKVNSSGLLNKYWTYKDDTGDVKYTSGVQAGKQVFDTRNYIIDEGIPEISKKKVGDLLSKP